MAMINDLISYLTEGDPAVTRSMSDWVKDPGEYCARGLGSGDTSVEAGGGGVTLTSPHVDEPGLEPG